MTDFEGEDWYFEHAPSGSQEAFGVRIERSLAGFVSPFQHIEIYGTKSLGLMLVLDGIIQLTERDEAAYHEMLVHVPMSLMPSAHDVLVVGGGDGGVLRELIKYNSMVIKRITICEIDYDLINLAKKHLQFVSCGYDDPRITIQYGDAAEYVRKTFPRPFNLIVVDSPDPIGPATALYTKRFIHRVAEILSPEGYAIFQCQSIFQDLESIQKTLRYASDVFNTVRYLNVMVPSYPSGVIGLMLCTNQDYTRQSWNKVAEGLHYYTSEVQAAALILPKFAQKALGQYLKKGTHE